MRRNAKEERSEGERQWYGSVASHSFTAPAAAAAAVTAREADWRTSRTQGDIGWRGGEFGERVRGTEGDWSGASSQAEEPKSECLPQARHREK